MRETTIQALQQCVEHAAAHGSISNAGVAQSLLAKLEAGKAALERGQPAVAIAIVEAFVHEIEAQTGTSIDAEHARHLRTHAEMVIGALRDRASR